MEQDFLTYNTENTSYEIFKLLFLKYDNLAYNKINLDIFRESKFYFLPYMKNKVR